MFLVRIRTSIQTKRIPLPLFQNVIRSFASKEYDQGAEEFLQQLKKTQAINLSQIVNEEINSSMLQRDNNPIVLSTPTSLPSTSPDFPRSTDASDYILFAPTDPFPQLTNHFHPAIMRAFKNSRSLKNSSPEYQELLTRVEIGLKDLNYKLISGKNTVSQLRQYLKSYHSTCHYLEMNFAKVLKSINSDEELLGMISLMVLLLPNNFQIWRYFDTFMDQKINIITSNAKNPSHALIDCMEYGLLSAYALIEAGRKLRLNFDDMKTPRRILLQLFHYAEWRKSVSSENLSSRNIFDFLSSISSITDEVHTPLGASIQVLDSRSIELLSLQQTLFTNPKILRSVINQFEKKATLEESNNGYQDLKSHSQLNFLKKDFSIHMLNVLSSIHQPIKLNSLKYLWESIPRVHLADAYLINKRIYQLLQLSLATDPMQLMNCEESIISLYEAMILAGFKSSNVLRTINEAIFRNGINYGKYGIKIFNLLIQLNCIEDAMKLLEIIMNGSEAMRALNVQAPEFIQNYHQTSSVLGSRGILYQLSDEAKEHLFKYLAKRYHFSIGKNKNDKYKSTNNEDAMPTILESDTENEMKQTVADRSLKHSLTSDLILSLFCFHRENKDSQQYKLFSKIEYMFLDKQIENLTVRECIAVIRNYAHVGRKNTKLLQKIFSKLGASKEPFDITQLSMTIWVCAKLYYKPPFLQNMISAFFQLHEKLNSDETKTATVNHVVLIRTLWSLSVLQMLSIEQFKSVESRIYQLKKSAMNWGSLGSLIQTYTELYQSTDPKGRRSSRTLESLPILKLMKIENETEKELDRLVSLEDLQPLKDYIESFTKNDQFMQRVKLGRDLQTSYTHMDISRVLKEQGINHECEKLVLNNYLIDIFIPYNANYPWSDRIKKDIVIEFDGPLHYDSYNNHPLGPTLIKRRQLQDAGYHVVVIPHWKYNLKFSEIQKYETIREGIIAAIDPTELADFMNQN